MGGPKVNNKEQPVYYNNSYWCWFSIIINK